MKDITDDIDMSPCEQCRAVVGLVGLVFRTELFHEIAENLIIMMCDSVISNLDYYSPALCRPVTLFFGHTVIYDVFARHLLRVDIFCSKYFNLCEVPTFVPLPVDNYINKLLSTKSTILKENNYINTLYDEMHRDNRLRETIKVVHLSDLHLDFDYVVGANSDCGMAMCCRSDDGEPASEAARAGPFGEYKCDLP